jgi:colanic acid biosynthesis glycosyl transferase WcaI
LASGAASEIQAAAAGIVVNANEPSALAESLIALKGSPETASRLGRAGVEHARGVLSREQALAGYDRFLDALVGATREVRRVHAQ